MAAPLSQIFTPCQAPSRRLGHRRVLPPCPRASFQPVSALIPSLHLKPQHMIRFTPFAFSGFSRQQQRAPVPIYSPAHHSAHARLALIHDLFCACHKWKCSPLPYRSHVQLAPVRCLIRPTRWWTFRVDRRVLGDKIGDLPQFGRDRQFLLCAACHHCFLASSLAHSRRPADSRTL